MVLHLECSHQVRTHGPDFLKAKGKWGAGTVGLNQEEAYLIGGQAGDDDLALVDVDLGKKCYRCVFFLNCAGVQIEIEDGYVMSDTDPEAAEQVVGGALNEGDALGKGVVILYIVNVKVQWFFFEKTDK